MRDRAMNGWGTEEGEKAMEVEGWAGGCKRGDGDRKGVKEDTDKTKIPPQGNSVTDAVEMSTL